MSKSRTDYNFLLQLSSKIRLHSCQWC